MRVRTLQTAIAVGVALVAVMAGPALAASLGFNGTFSGGQYETPRFTDETSSGGHTINATATGCGQHTGYTITHWRDRTAWPDVNYGTKNGSCGGQVTRTWVSAALGGDTGRFHFELKKTGGGNVSGSEVW